LSVASTPESWGSIRISTPPGADVVRITEPSTADPHVNEVTSPLLTTVQAADYLQVSTRTVKSLLSEGSIAYVKVGRTTRIHLNDLDHFIAQNRQKHRTRLRGRR
jgi:excisionase family DNA binding protein